MSNREQGSGYYVARKAQLLRDLDRFSKAILEVLATQYGEAAASEMLAAIRREYEQLIPQIPYIGGRKNRLTSSLTATVVSLALYKVLRAQGEEVARAGAIHQQIVERALGSLPQWQLGLMRALSSTRLGLGLSKGAMKRAAARSQERVYAEDFVFHYVEGEGAEFDFGLDYEECAVLKFYRAQGAEAFAPYVCLYDYPQSRLTGTGLVRTMTLAEGGERCDFRFRIGREPENRQRTQVVALDEAS